MTDAPKTSRTRKPKADPVTPPAALKPPRTRKPKATDKLTEPTLRELEDAATAPPKPARERKPKAPTVAAPETPPADDPIPPTERVPEIAPERAMVEAAAKIVDSGEQFGPIPMSSGMGGLAAPAPERYRSPETKARAALDARTTGVLTHPHIGNNRKARRAARSAARAIRHAKRSSKARVSQ